jgi:hypothetical protein
MSTRDPVIGASYPVRYQASREELSFRETEMDTPSPWPWTGELTFRMGAEGEYEPKDDSPLTQPEKKDTRRYLHRPPPESLFPNWSLYRLEGGGDRVILADNPIEALVIKSLLAEETVIALSEIFRLEQLEELIKGKRVFATGQVELNRPEEPRQWPASVRLSGRTP